jgi:ABC-type transporter Mla MlaB component
MGRDGCEVATIPVSGPGRPDLSTVDLLARWQLRARHAGCSISVRAPCPELLALLDLAGIGPELGLADP